MANAGLAAMFDRGGQVNADPCVAPIFFIESFAQMCFEGKWLQNLLRAEKNESISLLAVDIQGDQRGGFCIRRSISSSSSLSLKYALKESGCRICYEPKKMSRFRFWRSISRETNVEVSALSPMQSCET